MTLHSPHHRKATPATAFISRVHVSATLNIHLLEWEGFPLNDVEYESSGIFGPKGLHVMPLRCPSQRNWGRWPLMPKRQR